jgi:hypothetical protein
MSRYPPSSNNHFTNSQSNTPNPMLSGNTGTRLDYSRINEITNTMKERLKKKYESASQMSADATSSANETPSDINVLDSYISDIENLFLNGIINGDLRVSGKIYADSVETANELINTSYIQNRNPSEVRSQKLSKQELQTMIDSISEGITWIRQNIKHSTIESSRLVRCQFFNPDFVNEVRFRDNTICEQKLRVGGTQDTNSKYALEVLGETYMNGNTLITGNSTIIGNTSITGNLTVDSDTLMVDSSNNRIGIGKSSPNVELDVSGYIMYNILRKGGNVSDFSIGGTNTYASNVIQEIGTYPLSGSMAQYENASFVIEFLRVYSGIPMVFCSHFAPSGQALALKLTSITSSQCIARFSNPYPTRESYAGAIFYQVIGIPA